MGRTVPMCQPGLSLGVGTGVVLFSWCLCVFPSGRDCFCNSKQNPYTSFYSIKSTVLIGTRKTAPLHPTQSIFKEEKIKATKMVRLEQLICSTFT